MVCTGGCWFTVALLVAHVSVSLFLLAKGDFRRVQGSGTNKFKQSYWLKALNWSQLDEGPKPKSGKLWLNLHGTCFEGKINLL